MKITNKVNLDLMRPSWLTTIDAVQDDKYSRSLELTLTCNGTPWEIPADASAAVRYSKPNGTGGLYDTLPDGAPAWSAQGNVLTLILAPQVLTTAGPVHLAVTLIRGQEQLTTFPFLVKVHPGVDVGAAASEPYYHVPGFLPAPASSAAGQLIRVLAVDEQGHVAAVEAADGTLPTSFLEEEGAGRLSNPVGVGHPLWQQWEGRLTFGMEPQTAPVPFLVEGQLLADGTIIAHNTGSQGRNRWGCHLFEGYSRNNFARLTMLADKHGEEAGGKASGEIYYYLGSDHSAAAYGNTKVGSDVAFHSFSFDRDKLTAFGEIDSKMPITLARIRLSQDLDTSCETVAAADAAWDPETQYASHLKCLKYLALKNAENGAMFYDADRNVPVCKVNGKWCDLPFTVITDPSYALFQDVSGGSEDIPSALTWESGVIGGYGDLVANPNRIRTAEYLPEGIATVTAQEGYEFCLIVLREDGGASNDCYYNPSTQTKHDSPTWTASLDISGIAIPGYPLRKLIARRTDLGVIDPSEGANITIA